MYGCMNILKDNTSWIFNPDSFVDHNTIILLLVMAKNSEDDFTICQLQHHRGLKNSV